MVLYQDGKLMKDFTRDEKVRPIISESGIEQLLQVPKLPSGTGHAMADVMMEALSERGVKDCIKDDCIVSKHLAFDTTANYTRRKMLLGYLCVESNIIGLANKP